MNHQLRNSFLLLLSALLVFVVGVVGYKYLGDLNWVDALYMTVITLTTVGFSETPAVMDAPLKLFTVLLLLSGGGIFLMSANSVVELILDPRTRRAWRRRRMEQEIEKLDNHYVIFGAGRLGLAAARELEAEGVRFVLIESDEGVANKLLEIYDWYIIEGNAMEEDTLRLSGLERARGVVSCLSSDPLNLMALITARELNPDCYMVTRAVDEASVKKLQRAGATKVVPEYTSIGTRLARSVTRPKVTRLMDELSDRKNREIDLVEFEVAATSAFVGKTILNSGLRKDYGMTLVAVIYSDGSTNVYPQPEDEIQAGETLVLLGPPSSLEAMGQL